MNNSKNSKKNVPKGKLAKPLPTVSAPAAKSTGQRSLAPKIVATRDSCRIVHRELISSVTGTVAYTVAQTFALNPGLSTSFPWLSSIAQSWETYRFNSLKFRYYTRTGTSVPGSVLLVPDYDAADSAPATEQIASSFQGVVEDAPWKDIICNLPAPLLNQAYKAHFNRNGPLAANQDIKTYDSGNLFLCTIDGTAVPWGKLWVEYDVTFSLPQLPPAGASPYGGAFAGLGTQTGANPFGVTPAADSSNLGVTMNTASVLSFSAIGDFVVSASYIGTVITAIPAPTAGAGITIIGASSDFKAAATTGTIYVIIRVSSLVAATLAFSLTATTVTSASLGVGQAPAGSLN